MADVQKWRQMIQPPRAKTSESSHGSDGHCESVSQPPTPRRRSRPKLYSYLSGYRTSTLQTNEPEPFTTDYFTNVQFEDNGPQLDPEQAVNALYSRLIGEPHTSLPLNYHSMILRVLESYTSLVGDKKHHQEQINEEVSRRHAAELQLQEAGKVWASEQRTYKAEIKRLELLIARGKKGVGEVLQARVNSIIHRRKRAPSTASDEQRETVYEFIERSQKEEKEIKKTQRVPMRHRPPSPSRKMAEISKKLASTSVHADLPFHAPPSSTTAGMLVQARPPADNRSSSEPSQGARERTEGEEGRRPRSSTDAVSTFSSKGDLLPDEMEDGTAAAHADKDYEAVRSLAEVLARRRGLRLQDVLPELLSFFETLTEPHAARQPAIVDTLLDKQTSTYYDKPSPDSRHQKQMVEVDEHRNPPLRRRPPLKFQTGVSWHRRPFSFCPGDDLELEVGRRRSGSAPTVRSSILSLSSLAPSQESFPDAPKEHLSTSEDRTASLPAPTEEETSLSPSPAQESKKPRPRRDISASSIITTIQASQDPAQRRSLGSSSQYSVATTALRNSAGSNESSQDASSIEPRRVQKSSSSQRLVGHKSSPRGPAAALAAARAAGRISRSPSSGLGSSGGSGNSNNARKPVKSGSTDSVKSDAVKNMSSPGSFRGSSRATDDN